MYRVMPWAYPTIPGQSSGGTSVDPTPDPTPSGPYDLTDFNVKLSGLNWNGNIKEVEGVAVAFYFILTYGGQKEIDTSNVSSAKLTFGSGNLLTSGGGSIPLSKFGVNWANTGTPFYMNGIEGEGAVQPVLSKSEGSSYIGQTVTGFSNGSTAIITVYNSAGEVLQTKEVVIT